MKISEDRYVSHLEEFHCHVADLLMLIKSATTCHSKYCESRIDCDLISFVPLLVDRR